MVKKANQIRLIAILLVNIVCGVVSAQVSTPISTPNGTKVEATIEDFNAKDVAYWEYEAEEWLAARAAADPSWATEVIRTAPATAHYNCHSYAWYRSEGGTGNYWIRAHNHVDRVNFNFHDPNTPPSFYNNIKKYWEDGSYIEVPESIATKVWYGSCWEWDGNGWIDGECDHSAVRITSGIHAGKYESKWGPFPRYIHPADKSYEYNIAHRRYFTRKPAILSNTNVVCSNSPSAEFSIENPPYGAIIEWTAGPSLFVQVPNGGTSVVVAHNSLGTNSNSWLKVEFSTNGQVVHALTQQYDLIVNPPTISSITITTGVIFTHVPTTIKVSHNSPTSQPLWYIPDAFVSVAGKDSAEVRFSAPGSYLALVTVENACGASISSRYFKVINHWLQPPQSCYICPFPHSPPCPHCTEMEYNLCGACPPPHSPPCWLCPQNDCSYCSLYDLFCSYCGKDICPSCGDPYCQPHCEPDGDLEDEEDFGIEYHPNPVDNELIIDFKINANVQKSANRQSFDISIILFDNMGNIRRESKFTHHRQNGNPNPVKFNISNLREGTYHLHIYNGMNKTPQKHQIVVKR